MMLFISKHVDKLIAEAATYLDAEDLSALKRVGEKLDRLSSNETIRSAGERVAKVVDAEFKRREGPRY